MGLRVVMLSKALIVGAYQKKAEELARFPDVELTVIVPPSWNEAGRRIGLERKYTQGYDLLVEDVFFNGNFHFHFYPGLGRHLRRIRPQVFHIDEEPYNLATLQAMRLARSVGAKTLFFTWQNIYRRLPAPFSLIERYNLSRADLGVAGSRGAQEVLDRKGFRKHVAVIPQFGVDPDLYSPGDKLGSRSGVPSSRPFTIGYIGRFVAAKGLLVLFDALAGLLGRWECRLMGDGSLRDRLRRRAQELGIAHRILWLPPVPSGQVAAHLRDFDVLVLPSLTTPGWKEQFGRVLIEAMACEVPVVGSDSGEIPSVIGDAGLVAREGDADDLRAKLRLLRDDLALRERLAQAGRQRVLAHFTQARVAEDTYKLYKRLSEGQR